MVVSKAIQVLQKSNNLKSFLFAYSSLHTKYQVFDCLAFLLASNVIRYKMAASLPAQTQFSIQTIEKVAHMYNEVQSLLYDDDFETTDMKAKIVKRLIDRDPNAMCEAKYTIAVSDMIEELEHNFGINDFDFNEWLDKYVTILPQDPLEALSYDLILYKMFVTKNKPNS